MLDLNLVWGKAKTFRLTVRDASGALVNLTNKELRFSIKSGHNTDAALITKVTAAGITHDGDQPGVGKGLASLRLEPEDTNNNVEIKSNTVQTYICELELIQVADEPEILDTGFFTISPAVRTTV
jgi:hypothetical protein